MIVFLVSRILAALIVMVINAHALTITKHIVMGWVWLYSTVAPREAREGRRGEVLSHVHDLIDTYQKAGRTQKEIAVLILECVAGGMMDDVAWCIPFIPERLAGFADRVKGWSIALRHYKIPSAMIAGVGTLLLINYSLSSSQSNPTEGTRLLVNGMVIAITLLIWKRNHPLARQIFNVWMGVAIAGSVAVMVWLTINYRVYETTTFKVFLLAMVAASPAAIVADKSSRKRVFGGKWWVMAICWAAIVAGACVGSLLIAHDVKLLLVAWGVIALLVAGLFMLGGAAALAGYVLCWLGIRGGAGGLRLLASGIRRLR
jgi:hypothetical protein